MSISISAQLGVRAFSGEIGMRDTRDGYAPPCPAPRPAVWVCERCGLDLADACQPLRAGCRVDAEIVIARLEQAGATLLAMRERSPLPMAYGSNWPVVVHDSMEAYGWTGETPRAAIPDARAITAMDRAWAWLRLIPRDKRVLRRVVAARSLVHPVSGRALVSWPRLARILGCDKRAVQRWHAQGIGIIVARLQGE
jgi:uncharacterized protein DUF6362